jgi:protein-S-isoprenylcysteine O-methyltransferase Ste14
MSLNVFRHKGVRQFFVRLRVPLFVVALALLLPFAQRQWALAGFAVSMAGQLIQLWCFATLEKNETLASRGPYTMVRNPMYLGRYFLILGFVMLSGSWWAVAGYTVLYWLYMSARVGREEAHLRPIFGAAYDDYCARVRRFVPGLPLPGRPVLVWNWPLLRQNHGWRNLAGTLILWAAAAAWLFVPR